MEFTLNQFARIVRNPKTAAAGALAVLGSNAMAALPAGADTAISGAGTDVVTAIGLVILAGIGIYAAKLVGRKMGWL